MGPTVRLEAAGLETLIFDPFSGYVIQEMDLGYPATRASVDDAPDANGTIDSTAYFGARTVTVSLKLRPPALSSREAMRMRVRSFTNPALRPIMYVTLDDGVERQMMLRGSSLSSPIRTIGYAPVVVQWVAPYGILETATLNTADVNPVSAAAELGRAYDLTFNRAYPVSPTIGSATVTAGGTVESSPVIRVYGPCTNPVLYNDTQGKVLSFSSLTINAGEFLEIDVRNKTIRLNGLSTSNQYSKLVFPTSQWWTLAPGRNTVRFVPATSSGACVAQIQWRDAWL